MESAVRSEEFQHRSNRDLALVMMNALLRAASLNDFLEVIMPAVGRAFGTDRVTLVDYLEQTDHFDLLHYDGYPLRTDTVHELQRSFHQMQLERALKDRHPYNSEINQSFLCIPCYFRDVLEAVLVLESDAPIGLSDELRESGELTSRFLGLLMSSSRLAVNRGQLPDLNDLRRARQIQLSFLPQEPPRSEAWEVFGYNRSSAMVGGDYFDFFRARERSLQCILADACGHGLASALIMSNFRGLLRREMLRHEDFGDLFDELNQAVHFEADFVQFLTGVFLDFQEETRRLRYLNAGHYEPLVVAADSTRTLPGGGPPLGMFGESNYPVGTTELDAGDLIVLFTDGLVDIENQEGEYFGIEGIERALLDHSAHSLEQLCERVIGKSRDFAGENAPEDDITLFLMRVN